MEEPELPESWREALRAEDTATESLPPFKRAPIQPSFRFWPWGTVGLLAPMLSGALALWVTLALQRTWPNLAAALCFFAMLGALQAIIAGRAIDPEKATFTLLWRGILTGVASVLIGLIPGAAQVIAVFLIAFMATRVVARLGFVTLFFVVIVEATALVFFDSVHALLDASIKNVLAADATVLSVSLVLAYPLLNGVITAFFPVERTVFARLDASFAGLSAALLGEFAALVLYRTGCFVLMLAGYFVPFFNDERVVLGAGVVAAAAGNTICVWSLFSMAYSAREEARREETVRDVAARAAAKKRQSVALQNRDDDAT